MLVWIVNPFDNLPAEGYRPQRYWLMARAFAAAGHRVVYWTGDFSHASKRRREMKFSCREHGIDLRMAPVVPYAGNVGLRRLYSHWRLAGTWRRLAKAESVRPDALVASTPPLSLCHAAMRFARRCGALAVADAMDAWPETFERVAPRWTLFPLRRLARRIYTGADAVSAVAARYLDLVKSYGAACPTRLAYHGIDISGGMVCPERRSRPVGDAIRAVYAGAFGASYDLETAIETVKRMPDATLDLAGSGPKEVALKRLAQGCPRIRFHGYLDDVALKALLARCDVGLVPMFPESCVGVPYKLADYAAAGLRIVECLGGETQALVARFRVGTHYAPGDAASLAAALRALPDPDGDASGLARLFDASRIMPEYVAWVESLVAEKKGLIPQ